MDKPKCRILKTVPGATIGNIEETLNNAMDAGYEIAHVTDVGDGILFTLVLNRDEMIVERFDIERDLMSTIKKMNTALHRVLERVPGGLGISIMRTGYYTYCNGVYGNLTDAVLAALEKEPDA